MYIIKIFKMILLFLEINKMKLLNQKYFYSF
jgi:hypothetical protein